MSVVARPRPAVKTAAKRPCPRCPGIHMSRHFFSVKRQVEIDDCPSCGGVWLDAGELAEKEFGPTSPETAESLGNLAALYTVQQRQDLAQPLKRRAEAIRRQRGIRGPSPGLETEIFIDEIARRKGEAVGAQRAAVPPQAEDTRKGCDVDFDGDCDQDDLRIFRASLGKCQQDFRNAQDVEADVDGDGCVTITDERYLFPDQARSSGAH